MLEEPCEERGEPSTQWFGETPRQLTLTVRPEARWICEYYPTTEVRDDGELVHVTFPVASLDWATSLLLRLGASVVGVSDEAIAEAARARAADALVVYAGTRGVGSQA